MKDENKPKYKLSKEIESVFVLLGVGGMCCSWLMVFVIMIWSTFGNPEGVPFLQWLTLAIGLTLFLYAGALEKVDE